MPSQPSELRDTCVTTLRWPEMGIGTREASSHISTKTGHADCFGSSQGSIPVFPDSPDREPGLGFHMLGSGNMGDGLEKE